MNIRRSILWLAAAVITLLVVIVWLTTRRPAEISAASEINTSLPSAANRTAATHKVSSNAPLTTTNINPKPGHDKKEVIQEGLAALNDVPIVFYGKLEDQFSNPIVGAEIIGSTIVYNGTTSRGQRLTATSDANGLFQFYGSNAESLGMMPRKDGYVLAATNTEFKYSGFYPESRHVPDPINPVIINMWKLQGAEPLVAINGRFKQKFTDEPVNFDLLTGKIVPTGGDIKILMTRPPGVVSQRNPQDWSVQIAAVDGGLIETSMAGARVTYVAPDTGYQPTDTLLMSITNHWSDLIQQMFFVSSRNGQVFSKVFLSLSVNINQDAPASVMFRGVANAKGSRNWEADADAMKPQ